VRLQGMVDPGEVVTTTVRREFIEEATNSLALSEDDQRRMYQQIDDFFKKFSHVISAALYPHTRWFNEDLQWCTVSQPLLTCYPKSHFDVGSLPRRRA